jgi:cell division transport system permease protein
LSVLTLTAAFLSFAATLTAAKNVDSVVSRWIGSAELTVYLRQSVGARELERLAEAVTAIDGVGRVEAVDQRSARERFAAGLGAYEDLARGLPETAFPASLEVHLAPGLARDQQARHELAGRLGQVEMVEEVAVYDDWFERLSALSLIGRLAAWGLGLLAALVAMLVVAAAIRAGVGARRQEIEVLRFVGATDRYLRLPFLIEGLLEAAVAMGLALLVLQIVVGRVEQLTGDVLPLLGAGGIVRLGGMTLVALLLGGALAGLVGARLSLRRLGEI